MIKRLDTTEVIFKIIAYLFLVVFALFCLYPFVYSISAALSGRLAFENGKVVLFPIDVQFNAFLDVFNIPGFWVSYANTLFITFFGTMFSLVTTLMGAYTLSKKNLPFRTLLSFFIVFTMWFTAGFVPQFQNYTASREIFRMFTNDDRWLVLFAMGMAGFNVVLMRNAFEGVSSEIEEAAIVDGATEIQLLRKVYIPMSKAGIATITLFYAISRWNGFFWASTMISDPTQVPLQVFIRQYLANLTSGEGTNDNLVYSPVSLMYAMVVVSIVPILIVYPYIQKYFAKGVNVGGVKE